MGWREVRGSALDSLISCLLVNRATVLAVEYVESEVQEEKTGLEVEMQDHQPGEVIYSYETG